MSGTKIGSIKVLGVRIGHADDCQRGIMRRFEKAFHCGEFDRLVFGHFVAVAIAGRKDRKHGEDQRHDHAGLERNGAPRPFSRFESR